MQEVIIRVFSKNRDITFREDAARAFELLIKSIKALTIIYESPKHKEAIYPDSRNKGDKENLHSPKALQFSPEKN